MKIFMIRNIRIYKKKERKRYACVWLHYIFNLQEIMSDIMNRNMQYMDKR